MILDFELNDEEREQIKILSDGLNNKLKEASLNSENISDVDKQASILQPIIHDYLKEFNPIYSKARERTMKFYSSRIKKLTVTLELAVKNKIRVNYTFAFEGMPQDDFANWRFSKERLAKWKNDTIEELKPYLDLLKSKNPKEHKKILEFIDYAFENAEKIYKEEAKKPQEGKTVKITPKRVTKAIQPTDKITHSLFDPSKNSIFYERDKEAVDIIVGRRNGKEVTTAVAIDFSELDGVKFSNGVMLDPYAQAVHNAMLSMYYAGNKGGSLIQLFKVMNGYKETLKAPEAKALNDMKEAIEKMRHTDATITIGEERKLYPFKRAIIKNYVMPVKMVEVSINGQKADGFIFLDKPPLYEYASQKKQLNTFDVKFFDVPLSATKETMIILNYLNERLQGALNKKSNLSDRIVYDTLYELLELDAPTEETLRAKKRDVRKKVKTILESWMKAGKIKGYEEEIAKPNNKARAIKFLL